MRFFLTLSALFLLTGLTGQIPFLEFTVRYNLALSRYEVYARPDASLSNFSWGPSQISLVVPANVPNEPFLITPVSGGAWQDNSRVYAPSSAPGFDFHGVGSLGALTPLEANIEKLIFHFTLPGGNCTPGFRLFINGVDPNSSAPGMNGGDFSNSIFAIVPAVPGGYESYIGNYDNTGVLCAPLPLVLQEFYAEGLRSVINLNWLTEQENGFDYFELERTTDGKHFESIAVINANSGQSGRYNYTDFRISAGITYFYRLKMVDRDQSYTYSKQVAGQLESPHEIAGWVLPNPSSGPFTLHYRAAAEEETTISIIDINGRVLKQQKVDFVPGLNSLAVDISEQRSGVYLVALESKQFRLVLRVIRK